MRSEQQDCLFDSQQKNSSKSSSASSSVLNIELLDLKPVSNIMFDFDEGFDEEFEGRFGREFKRRFGEEFERRFGREFKREFDKEFKFSISRALSSNTDMRSLNEAEAAEEEYMTVDE